MWVCRVPITRQVLSALPRAERDFFLLAGHMLNELSSVRKLFAWCSRGHADHAPPKPFEGNISTAQAMIYARVLAGKEWEAWDVLGKAFFGTKISQHLEPRLPLESQTALKGLKTYFNSANLIFAVRNSFAFHYSAEAIGATWERAAAEPFCETILGGNIGNNFYLAAETAANVAVFSSVEPNNPQAGMGRFLNDVGETSDQFIAFLEGVNIALYEMSTGQKLSWDAGVMDEVFPSRTFSQVSVPHFCLPDDPTQGPPATEEAAPAPQP
jgi:hypothetical protein